MKRWLLLLALVVLVSVSSLWLWVQVAPLDAIVRGGDGPPSLVLLHGYGSRAGDWLQFEHQLQVPQNVRLVFPQGPLRGPGGGRGWWWLNIEGHIPAGERFPDFSTANPGGIKVASRLVRDLLDREPGAVILGGFSQGAMLSAEIAFQTDQPLAALVLLGGTTVNETAWLEGALARKAMPIFIAHGRGDGVLPFAAMERLQARLTEAGLDVTWFPFSGGHNVPDTVIAALNEFLAGVQLGG
ncbi:MAG: alpha/beta fold hydrolase [Acidobacteriota bacterium]|nr:alpha/beta fold hydrolase [Acidobacteriota bacterium]